jgi:AcrR family transcriptional regulator
MDEIARAAGLRRSTLYLHYKDKAQILTDIIADYTPEAKALLATLPGPKPTLPQLQRWVGEVAKFVARKRGPLSIILEVRRTSKAHIDALHGLTAELLAGLGENNPLFRMAAPENADPMLRARAFLLLRELIYACEIYLDETNKKLAKAVLLVTAEDFHAFLSKHKA